MVDPMGTLIAEGRTANLASGRVRGYEPAPKSDGYEGDALGAGHYKRFVVLSTLAARRITRVPVAEFEIGYRCYGATPQDAWALYGEFSDTFHLTGGRTSGIVIYQSVDDVGGTQDKDPVTHQPYVSGQMTVVVGTEAAA